MLSLKEKILIFYEQHQEVIDELLKFLISPRRWLNEQIFISPEYRRYKALIRASIAKLEKEGYLVSYGDYGKKKFKLTIKGEKWINWEQTIKRKTGKWDGKWYLVVFDIPEKYRRARDNLRRKLYELGFGFIQKSVFISPYNYLSDIKKLAEKNQVQDFIRLMVVTEIDNPKDIVKRCWDFKKLNKKYQDFIKRCKETKASSRNIGRFERYLKYKEMEKELAKIFKEDPFLPHELLPCHIDRDKAIRALQSLRISV